MLVDMLIKSVIKKDTSKKSIGISVILSNLNNFVAKKIFDNKLLTSI